MTGKVIHHPHAALADLAKQINAEHEAVVASLRTSVERAIALGELLTKARKQVGHGRWERWVTTNTKVGARMARNYMRLAALGPEDRKRVSDLGVRQALDVIERAEPAREVAVEVRTVKHTIALPHYEPRSPDVHLPHAIAPPVVTYSKDDSEQRPRARLTAPQADDENVRGQTNQLHDEVAGFALQLPGKIEAWLRLKPNEEARQAILNALGVLSTAAGQLAYAVAGDQP